MLMQQMELKLCAYRLRFAEQFMNFSKKNCRQFQITTEFYLNFCMQNKYFQSVHCSRIIWDKFNCS